MLERRYSKQEWIGALRGLSGKYRVYVPVKQGELHVFEVLKEGMEPDFTYSNTRLSAKGILYPPSERMFECSLDEKGPEGNIYKEPKKDYSPQAVVGIRPCDAQGLEIVKRNFDNPEFRDPWWARRYESTVLVGLGCEEPRSTCFCTSVGGGPFSEEGLDVLLYAVGDRFLARAVTAKGEGFLTEAGGGAEAGDEVRSRAKALEKGALEKMGRGMACDCIGKKKINELFEASFWEETAFPCINCGTCTYLCPTCWCFDIQDEVLGRVADRIRNWDSCMFPLFTLHGSGHNPRDKKHQRVRQRFMHKLKYYPEKYGKGVQCSGCGRCVRYCPVNIDIREVAERMNEGN
ncbi:MAG: 4Fe-4S dicluster domain-containing protein [Thermodesulfobacteriota bacterium]